MPPVLLQVHREVASDDHTPTIGHKSSLIHVSHQGIDKWHSSLSITPSVYDIQVSLPIVVVSIVDAITREHLVAILHTPVALEVSPEELINEDCSRLVSCLLFLELFDLPVDLARRDASIGEPWGQF